MLSPGLDQFRARCGEANGLVHLVTSGETSWHGFAAAIVEGLKERKIALALEHVRPITSAEYPTRAKRPHNSRLDLSRLHKIFGITPAHWKAALAPELDVLGAGAMGNSRVTGAVAQAFLNQQASYWALAATHACACGSAW